MSPGRRARAGEDEIELADLSPVGRARFEEDYSQREQFMPSAQVEPVGSTA